MHECEVTQVAEKKEIIAANSILFEFVEETRSCGHMLVEKKFCASLRVSVQRQNKFFVMRRASYFC